MLAGHQHLVEDFKSLMTARRLFPSYIFFGEPSLGKFHFARHVAAYAETGTFDIGVRALQDTLIVDGDNGIDAMRHLKAFLWQKPASGYRTAIVNDADGLTVEAQNAILKVAEEPPAHALLILIARQPDNLIVPIASRFQHVYFGRVTELDMVKFGLDAAVIKAAHGRPGRAVRLAAGELKDVEAHAAEMMRLKGSERSRFIKDLIEASKEKPRLIDDVVEALCAFLMGDPLRHQQLLREISHRFFLIKSYNVNKRLQLEAMF